MSESLINKYSEVATNMVNFNVGTPVRVYVTGTNVQLIVTPTKIVTSAPTPVPTKTQNVTPSVKVEPPVMPAIWFGVL